MIGAALGIAGGVAVQKWPAYDPALLESGDVVVVVQVNGKLRGEIRVPRDLPESEILSRARENEKVVPHLAGKKIVKSIYVPGRLVNFVVAA